TLDLKSAEGVEVLTTLVGRSDVLIENFRTGTMESFGLGYETLAAVNPRLIYCSISAFGRTGPRADGAGYEALMQAFSGIMSITGEPDGPPVRCGVSFLDLTTGILCAFGIVNALLHRERTGLGQRLDGSLLETAVALLNYHAARPGATAEGPRGGWRARHAREHGGPGDAGPADRGAPDLRAGRAPAARRDPRRRHPAEVLADATRRPHAGPAPGRAHRPGARRARLQRRADRRAPRPKSHPVGRAAARRGAGVPQ